MHGRILSVDLVYAEQMKLLPANYAAVGIDIGRQGGGKPAR